MAEGDEVGEGDDVGEGDEVGEFVAKEVIYWFRREHTPGKVRPTWSARATQI